MRLEADELSEMLTTGFRSMDWNIGDRIQSMDRDSILEGLELTNETIKKNRLDEYLKKLLHTGAFESTKNPFAKLVSGYGYDEKFFLSAPEQLLKTWIIEFAEFLSKQRERLERSPSTDNLLYQAWQSLRGGMN